jgi:hypothetical protein
MARRYRRDLIGHFIRNQQRTQQPCTHACCRGYRVHPANYPVILPDRTLHRASDDDLAQHFRRVSAGTTPGDRRAELQILHEMERRDRIEQQRRDRAAAAQARQREHRAAVASAQAARRMERDAEAQRIKMDAEEYTKGYLVTAQGRARGIADEEILTGRQEVFLRYATPEAKAYFADHPRPTAAYFRGRDTRIPYSDRPTRRPTRRTRALGWAPPRAPSRPRRATRALGWGDERQAG